MQLIDHSSSVCSVFNCAAIFIEQLREAAQIIDCLSDIVFCCTTSCMTAQTAVELNYWEKQKMQVVDWERGNGVPHYMKMQRNATPGAAASV